MRAFVYDQPESRVVLDTNVIDRLSDEVRALGCDRAILIATPSQQGEAERAAGQLGALAVAVLVESATHIPIDIVDRAEARARENRADIVVSIGGGNAIGVGKVVALRVGIPAIAIPTTYSGSEASPNYGWTEDGIKKVSRDEGTLPRTILYDPSLAVSLPRRVSAASGMNAMAHLVMGLYAGSSPIARLLAREGIRTLARALPAIVANPRDLDGRSDAFFGSWLAGSMLRMGTGRNIHYVLSHILGGTFGLGHAEVHSVLLPHSVALLHDAEPDASQWIAQDLAARSAASGLFDLASELGCPTSLEAVGMRKEGLDRVVKQASADDAPTMPTRDRIMELVENAFSGKRPD